MRRNYTKLRGAVALAFVVFAVAGLAFRVGTGTLSAFGIGSIAAICPLGSLEVLLGAKEFLLHPVILLAVAVVVIVITGKAFCSWACPVSWLRRFFKPRKQEPSEKGKEDAGAGADIGADEKRAVAAAELVEADGPAGEIDEAVDGVVGAVEAAGAVSKADGGIAAEVASVSEEGSSHACARHSCAACSLAPLGGKRDGVQIDTRHVVLASTLASAAVFGFPVFCLICPVGIVFATIIGLWNLFSYNEPSWALVIFPAILLIEVVFLRKWCVKICPISALLSLVSTANRTFKPRVDSGRCLREQGADCRICVDVCPEQVDPHIDKIPECTKCGACVEACPAQALSLRLLR